jgi:two-component sensor histidine kinase
MSAGMSIPGMRVVSEATIVVACFSAAFAILWYILNRRGLNRENRRAGYLLFACFLSCGLAQLADIATDLHPDATILVYSQAALVAAGLLAGLAVWPLLPALANLPSTQDLQDANRKLEGRVAERTSELLAANRRFEAALAGSAISVAQQDRDLRYTWAYNMPGALSDHGLAGARAADFMPSEAAARLDSAKRTAMDTGSPVRLELSVEIGDGVRWFEERIEPLFDGKYAVGVISTAVDVTTRKRHELELTGLLRELTHRSKNLLAVVQGIARQTGQSCASVDEFNRRFAGRLQALSLTHELLIATAWRHVDLRGLVDGVLAHVAPDRAAAVRVRGGRVLISPERAQSLAIALHEMAANAVAHGGLSQGGGALDVEWTTVVTETNPLVEFRWRETGGDYRPGARARGFGLSFVERLLPRALEGSSDLEFDEAGLTWRMSFPLDR